MHASLTADAQNRNRIAENAAQAHRLDIDRVVSGALDRLLAMSRQPFLCGDDISIRTRNAVLALHCGLPDDTDVLSLIDEVKRGLSPLVR